MLNTDLLPDHILNILRENYTENEINAMTRREIFEAWLEWQGFIGYTYKFIDVICSLFPTEESIKYNSAKISEIDFDYKIDESESTL